ncbi:Ndr family protein [Longimycelium tulufanense]|uniref:Ndr family protein n=1 Tax=Longimycelium tulufanense TaxID=907463 RepID=A0A8J3CEH6_9PSEU|nr:alpha/beta hydrolase [Longimycelium tulufanense]GGM48624.1 Ndr family protein [Longimycelium tulufanense]
MKGIYKSASGAGMLAQRYREALESWPVPSEYRRVPTSQGETFVLACGPEGAPPVLLLHGSSANALNWFADAPTWAGEFRLYAVDLIGEPGLSAPSRPPLGSADYARWLDEVLDALGLDNVAVVAESLGGWLAVDYATRRPDRVSQLALLCPGGIGRQKWGPLLIALLLLPFGAWGRRKSMALLCGTADIPEFALLIQRHYRPRMEKLPIFDDSALRQLTMPVLVVVGRQDRMFDSAGTQRRLARAVPHAAVIALSGAGHLLPRQTRAVLEFLRTKGSSNT